MHNSDDQIRYRPSDPLTFQTIEEGFDEWAIWLRSIIQESEFSSATREAEPADVNRFIEPDAGEESTMVRGATLR